MVSTPERFTDNSPMPPLTPVTVKNPSAIKLLRIFTEVLYVKKNSVHRVGVAKSNRKAIRAGGVCFSSIPNRRVHTKTNEQVKKHLYNWIIQHPRVFQSPIANDCLKLYIDGRSEPQVVLKLLLQVSV